MAANATVGRSYRAALVGVTLRRAAAQTSTLEELAQLARTAGVQPVRLFHQERDGFDPAYYMGRGKAEEVAGCVRDEQLDVVIFDDELAPNQQRNLEKIMHCRVLDRTLLVLDIFAARARTGEGKLQVELAQLTYLLPRLSGKGIELSRLGGGIGTRGPGETRLETDRRKIRRRISALHQELASVRRRRRLQRRSRRDIPAPTVALVGYTNAGKSTLFNALTQEATLVSARLFATLDPLVRGLRLPDDRLALVSDTVGFIRKLPHDLVAAFRATLEEVTEADLLLHVVDASATDFTQQIEAVSEVLESLRIPVENRLHVFNKVDLLDEVATDRLRRETAAFLNPVLVSAVTGEGIPELLGAIGGALPDRRVRVTVRLPYSQERLRARIHETGQVLDQSFDGKEVQVQALVDPGLADELIPYRVADDTEDAILGGHR